MMPAPRLSFSLTFAHVPCLFDAGLCLCLCVCRVSQSWGEEFRAGMALPPGSSALREVRSRPLAPHCSPSFYSLEAHVDCTEGEGMSGAASPCSVQRST
jgi:hypothetical protein